MPNEGVANAKVKAKRGRPAKVKPVESSSELDKEELRENREITESAEEKPSVKARNGKASKVAEEKPKTQKRGRPAKVQKEEKIAEAQENSSDEEDFKELVDENLSSKIEKEVPAKKPSKLEDDFSSDIKEKKPKSKAASVKTYRGPKEDSATEVKKIKAAENGSEEEENPSSEAEAQSDPLEGPEKASSPHFEEEKPKPKGKRGRPAKGTKKEAAPSKSKKSKFSVSESDEESSKEKEEDQDSDYEEKPKAKAKRGRPAKASKGKQPANKTSTNFITFEETSERMNALGKLSKLKITSWNVNGLRALAAKGGLEFIKKENADIVCLQETKCSEDSIPEEVDDFSEYKKYWLDSKQAGYAGVSLWSKQEPIKVKYGLDDDDMDAEGRMITAEFPDFYIVSVYVPNAGRKLVTLPKRLEWNEMFVQYVQELDKKKPVIVAGDMNVAHNEIDLARPKTNTKNAGFTMEERDGMSDFLKEGFVDTFRFLYPDLKDQYTFWTFLANARANNVGWRIDYFIVSDRIKEKVCDQKNQEPSFRFRSLSYYHIPQFRLSFALYRISNKVLNKQKKLVPVLLVSFSCVKLKHFQEILFV